MRIKKYLQSSPVFAINSAYEALIPSLNARLKSEGINLLQGLVLTALFFEGDSEVNPSQLSEMFQTSRGNMSHIISHLEGKGWVKRIVNIKDARGFRIELKSEGRKKALGLIKFYDQLQGQLEEKIGVSICQKIVENLRFIREICHSRGLFFD